MKGYKLIEKIFLHRSIYFKISQLNCKDMSYNIIHKTQSSRYMYDKVDYMGYLIIRLL